MVPGNVLSRAASFADMSLLTRNRFGLGAVIFTGKKILGAGLNYMKKTHPKSPHPHKFIHAEFSAAVGVPKAILRGSDIYVHRTGRDRKTRLAKPCVHCLGMLRFLGIRNIYYSTERGIEKLND